MNVSMMDSYNLSWKLVHSLHGLTPRGSRPGGDDVLVTFSDERVSIARQLIEFDSKFSSMFSGQIDVTDRQLNGLTHEMFLKVFSDGSGFTSGCGVEYAKSVLVDNSRQGNADNPVVKHDYLQGTLMPGRRLANARVKRFADSNARDLQDGECQPAFPPRRNWIYANTRSQISLPPDATAFSFLRAATYFSPQDPQLPLCAHCATRSSPPSPPEPSNLSSFTPSGPVASSGRTYRPVSSNMPRCDSTESARTTCTRSTACRNIAVPSYSSDRMDTSARSRI